MRSIRTCLAALRGERGDADPMAVLMGSLLFVTASVALGGLMTMTLASSSRAQSNTELTQSVESEISAWKTDTLYRDITATGTTPPRIAISVKNDSGDPEAAAALCASKGRAPGFVCGYQSVKRLAGSGGNGAWQMRIAVARQTLSTTPVDCKTALTTPNDACLTLVGTLSPAGSDKPPVAPVGVTVKAANTAQGVSLAGLRLADAVDTNGYLSVRVAVLPANEVKAGGWNVSFVCNNTATLKASDSTRLVKAEKNSDWLTGRAAVHSSQTASSTSCPEPKLLLWASTGTVKPTVESLTYENGVAQVSVSRSFGR